VKQPRLGWAGLRWCRWGRWLEPSTSSAIDGLGEVDGALNELGEVEDHSQGSDEGQNEDYRQDGAHGLLPIVVEKKAATDDQDQAEDEMRQTPRASEVVVDCRRRRDEQADPELDDADNKHRDSSGDFKPPLIPLMSRLLFIRVNTNHHRAGHIFLRGKCDKRSGLISDSWITTVMMTDLWARRLFCGEVEDEPRPTRE